MQKMYEVMFGEKPTKYSSPMIPKDHPELDLTPELDENGIKQYQSLIGALQWLVPLGRFDILIAVTTMFGYRIAPRQGHLELLSGSLDMSRDTLMVLSVSRQIFLTMKVNGFSRNSIGFLLSIAMSKQMCLMICLFLTVKLCIPQPTKIQTCSMI
jgi:hypothetical protein